MASLTVEQLLQHLERKGLLPPEVLTEVRAQVARNPDASARKIVRWLVKVGHISRYQAQELLSGNPADASRKADEIDELDVFDDLPEIPSSSPGAGSLPPLGAGAGASNPFDSLMQAAGLGSVPATGGGPLGLPGMPQRKKGPANVWESKLIIIGGAAVFLIAIIIVALLWRINRGTGDEAFAAADEEYAAGHYTQAIAKFDAYLKSYSDHANVSLARVHRGLAILRNVVGVAKGQGWIQALDEANKVIEEIRKEEKFSEAKPDLAAMLHNIADGLADASEERPDAKTVERCREAVRLTRNSQYVPANFRDDQRLARVEARLALVEKGLGRLKHLQETVEAIRQSIEKGEVAAVYQLRQRLVKEYPDIANDEQLREVVKLASEAERGTVKFVAEPRTAETKEVEGPVKTTLLASTTVTAAPPGAASHIVLALAEGAAYALDAASGKVLWRRFLGQETIWPLRTARSPDADVLLVDEKRGELVRVAATDGKLKWRIALPGVRTSPVVLRNRVLAVVNTPDKKGRLYSFALDTGATEGYIQVSQPIAAPPAVDRNEQFALLVGQHSNLYVLTLENRECRSVVYLGHDAGRIVAQPLIVGEYVLIGENRHERASWLRLLKLEEGAADARQLFEVRLDGHVQLPPITSGRTVLVPTDLGGVFLYDISPDNEREPLVRGPQKSATLKQRHLTFLHVVGARVWIANNQLASFEVQAAGGQLHSRWVDNEDSVFLQPLQVVGEVIFHIRKEPDKPGVIVSAMHMDQRHRYWETRLAPPAVAGAVVDPQRREAVVLLSDGNLYQTPVSQLLANAGFAVATGHVSVPEAPATDAHVNPRGVRVVRFAGGKLVFTWAHETQRVLVFDPAGPTPAGSAPLLRWVKLPDAAGGLCTALAGQLLVPAAVGSVYALNPFQEQVTADPFQPRMESGREYQWLTSLADNEPEALVSAGSRLFRVAARAQPRAHLASLSEGQLKQPLASSIARLEQTAYALSGEELIAFSLPQLRVTQSWKLRGQAVWGPGRIGKHVLLAVETEPHDEIHLKSGRIIKTRPLESSAVPPVASKDEKADKKKKEADKLFYRPWEAQNDGEEPNRAALADRVQSDLGAGSTSAKVKPKGKPAKRPTKAQQPAEKVHFVARSEVGRIRHYDDLVNEIGAYRLLCLDQAGRLAWDQPVLCGPLAGAPLAVSDGFLIASQDGMVCKLGGDGRMIIKVNIAQPLVGGPVALDEKHVLLTGRDGVLHVIPIL